jgi:hypothetical protein
VFDTLQESGFDISPGLFQDTSTLGVPVKGSALLYRRADANMADVTQGFIPNLTEREVRASTFDVFDLAVVVGPGFSPEKPGAGGAAATPTCG